MVTLLLSPAEGWGGPLGSPRGLWPLVDYNIETSINYFFCKITKITITLSILIAMSFFMHNLMTLRIK